MYAYMYATNQKFGVCVIFTGTNYIFKTIYFKIVTIFHNISVVSHCIFD